MTNSLHVLKNIKKYSNWLVLLTISVLMFYAWKNRFIQDDAFISFRYADNFVHGNGLVYNVGERVEGYTNFLWTMIMTIPLFLHWDIVLFSQVIGVALMGGTLYLTFLAAQKLYQSFWASLLTVIVIGSNFSFSAYATGGLETQLQAFLLMLSFWIFINILDQKKQSYTYVFFSLTLALLTLTRLDSAIFVLILLLATMLHIWKQKSQSGKLRDILKLFLPYILIIGLWFMGKILFYGDILPNTYYAKFADARLFSAGVNYIRLFLDSYFLWPLLLCSILGLALSLLTLKKVWFITAISMVTVWLLYIVKIGGDFMEFRMLMPIFPLVILSFFYPIYLSLKQALIPLTVLMVMIALYYPLYFEYNPQYSVETVWGLQSHISDEHWAEIGQKLRRIFSNTSVSIAVTPAGAIPFYSHLYTIDMLGLNDKYIAHFGRKYADFPGHQKVSSLDYLLQKNTNLIIAHPHIIGAGVQLAREDYIRAFSFHVPPESLSPTYKLLAIPMTEEYSVLAIYLTPSLQIDQLIAEHNWQTLNLQ